ncbi:MAG: hypothetical protein VKJ44_03700 [Synechococcus sp.]|nr:hypothetical protein [Synechococcus sp.]
MLAIAAMAGAGWAGPASSSPYPAASLFRSLQLILLGCSRDNGSASCEQAQRQADGLLDHPRLSSSCKDILWTIRQTATTTAANSVERRDRLDRTARDLPIFCRQPAAPISGRGDRAPAAGGNR